MGKNSDIKRNRSYSISVPPQQREVSSGYGRDTKIFIAENKKKKFWDADDAGRTERSAFSLVDVVVLHSLKIVI